MGAPVAVVAAVKARRRILGLLAAVVVGVFMLFVAVTGAIVMAGSAIAAEQEEEDNGGGGGDDIDGPIPSGDGWVVPTTNYWISDWFGNTGTRYHNGVDMAAPLDTPIYAAGAGRVTMSQWLGDYGWMVEVVHADGVTTRYAHMIRLGPADPGQDVEAGDVIGHVGSTGNSTGPHLHFETLVDGVKVDPVPIMRARGVEF